MCVLSVKTNIDCVSQFDFCLIALNSGVNYAHIDWTLDEWSSLDEAEAPGTMIENENHEDDSKANQYENFLCRMATGPGNCCTSARATKATELQVSAQFSIRCLELDLRTFGFFSLPC